MGWSRELAHSLKWPIRFFEPPTLVSGRYGRVVGVRVVGAVGVVGIHENEDIFLGEV